jgi:DNA mismatch endonuclease (patch repair protein)
VIFADGDFWHGKDFKKWKSKIPVFWRKKIATNILRDRFQDKALRKAGYRVLRFYGSKIKRNPEYIKKIIEKNFD